MTTIALSRPDGGVRWWKVLEYIGGGVAILCGVWLVALAVPLWLARQRAVEPSNSPTSPLNFSAPAVPPLRIEQSGSNVYFGGDRPRLKDQHAVPVPTPKQDGAVPKGSETILTKGSRNPSGSVQNASKGSAGIKRGPLPDDADVWFATITRTHSAADNWSRTICHCEGCDRIGEARMALSMTVERAKELGAKPCKRCVPW